MAIAQDVQDRLGSLKRKRQPWENIWREIAQLFFPMGAAGFQGPAYDGLGHRPEGAARIARVVDGTGMWAIDRLGAGIESMVSPIGQTWQGLGVNDVFGTQVNDYEQMWLDNHTRYLFHVRYSPRSGFQIANQQCIKAACALGTAFMYVEEWFAQDGVRLPYRYRPLPLSQCFADCNYWGEIDTLYQHFKITARTAVQRYGFDNLPDKIKNAANNANDKDNLFEFCVAVQPRSDKGTSSVYQTVRGSAYETFTVSLDENKLVKEGGFFEFPFIDYRWQPSDQPYSECPTMLALADVKALQVFAADEIRASRQLVDPPLGAPAQGFTNKLNLNSRHINYGAVNSRGELMVRPLITAQAPTFAQAVLQARRSNVQETLYIKLFQSLIDNPSMTATEAALRDQEKANLLGPAGVSFQSSYARLTERELGILERKGAYREDSMLAPPRSLRDRNVSATFKSPLERMRRLSEFTAIQRLSELVGALAQGYPEALDNLSPDDVVRLGADILGAPRQALRPEDVRDQLRQAKQQMQQLLTATTATKEVAGAVTEGAEAASSAAGLANNLGPLLQQLASITGQAGQVRVS